MSSPPASLIQTIQPALFLLVPLFSTALILLSISHKPHPGSSPSAQALLAYTSIAALTVLSTLSGALPLSHNSNPHNEALIQALLFLLLGTPVLHLPQTYAYTHSNDHNAPPRSILVVRIILAHTALLVITLSSATLLAFLTPYLPRQAPSSTANPLYYLPSALFLAYSLLSLPRLIFALNRFLNQRSPSFEFSTASPRNQIAIQVAAARTIPLTLPSPASSASFPLSGHHSESHSDQSHEIGLPVSLSRIPRRSGHEKISSISSTSTVTAVDHHTQENSEHTSVNHRVFTFSPQPVPHSAISSRLSSDGHHWGEGYYPESAVHQRQLFDSRSRSLFVFFISAQLTVSVAYSCIFATGLSSADHPLNIVKAACTVLAVTATMSGYLLHAYNSPFLLSRSRSSSSSSSGSSSSNPFSLSQRHPFYSRPDVSPDVNYDPEINTIQMIEARPQAALIQLASPLSRRKRVDVGLPLSGLTKNNSITKPRPFGDTGAWNPKSEPRMYPGVPAELTDDFDRVLDIGHVRRGTVLVSYEQPKELVQGQAAVCESNLETAGAFTSVFGREAEQEKEQDSSGGLLRRGSLPVPPSKAWEFGCAPLLATNLKGEEGATPTADVKARKRITLTEGLESLLKNRRGSIKRPNASQSPLPPHADIARGSTINRKLKKASSTHGRKKSTGSRPGTPDSGVVLVNSHPHNPTSPSTSFSGWCEAAPACLSGNKNLLGLDTLDVESSLRSPVTPTTPHRTMLPSLRKSSSSSGSGKTEGSWVTEDADHGVGRGGLALKKSFKLGVGRTLSPGLTLAAASGMGGASRSRSRGERREKMLRSEESVVEEDEGEEGKIRSIAVARRLSASYGRTREASTVEATTSPYSSIPRFTGATAIHNKRGALTSLVTTSATTRRSTSPSSFSASPITPASSSTWISHPSVEFVESAGGNRNIYDSVISLEKELEDMCIGRVKGENKVDFFGNGGVSTGLTVPSTSRPGEGTLLPTPATTPERPKSRTGGLSRKLGLSSNKEWAAQSSVAVSPSPPLPQGSPYRFPMTFPHSLSAASSANSIVGGSAPNLSRAPSKLSSKKMGSVRSAFAGVGARMSKMSVNSGAEGSQGSGATGPETLGLKEDDGDFMDLRDPFASPPSFGAVRRGGKQSEKRDFLPMDASLGGGKEDFEVGSSSVRRSGGRMSAWGRLPVPVKSASPKIAGKKPAVSSKLASCGRTGDRRKHKKEKRTRKRTMSGLGGFKVPDSGRVGEEDGHFDIEEALLAQRLLKKLDSDGWVGRA